MAISLSAIVSILATLRFGGQNSSGERWDGDVDRRNTQTNDQRVARYLTSSDDELSISTLKYSIRAVR